jgi:hypothetical protein
VAIEKRKSQLTTKAKYRFKVECLTSSRNFINTLLCVRLKISRCPHASVDTTVLVSCIVILKLCEAFYLKPSGHRPLLKERPDKLVFLLYLLKNIEE